MTLILFAAQVPLHWLTNALFKAVGSTKPWRFSEVMALAEQHPASHIVITFGR
jgi:hypothetical protein